MVVIRARKLVPYFQGYQIIDKTNYPIKKMLKKPGLTGMIVSWPVELFEYDISFVPRSNINSQALQDFLFEFSTPV